MFDVRVLGYWGAYPAPGEATTGYLLETEHEKILLDCGSGVLSQLLRVCPVDDLTAVVVTHHHHDHVADLGVLYHAVLVARRTGARTRPLPVYLPPGGSPQLLRDLASEPLIGLRSIDQHSTLQLGALRLWFTRTVHPAHCLAVRAALGEDHFVLLTDTAYDARLADFARDADLMLCEASMYDGQEQQAAAVGHLTAGQAGRLARAAGVGRLRITHYPHGGRLEELVAQAAAAFGATIVRLRLQEVISVGGR